MKPGPKPKPNTRDRIIMVRVSQAELKRIDHMVSIYEHSSRADFLRRCVFGGKKFGSKLHNHQK